ncbi:MAG: helix-turn-helix transcriptional regulator [Planctomycetes bacterium]|nr:helix-turn-helix transcriptional regulator [Planctomycetota bacterium]
MPKPTKPSLELGFGPTVRQHRERAVPSQEELGYRADRHRMYVSMLEPDERCPSLETIAKVARALDTKASALVAAWEKSVGT